MSMKKLAVIATAQNLQFHSNNTIANPYLGSGNVSSNGASKSGRFETDLHGNVNVLLGGAMLSGVITVVVLICYCCHRNIRKHRPQEYSQYWRPEPDVHSLEVFTMDSHAMRYECTSGPSENETTHTSLPANSTTPGAPPTYDSLIFGPQSVPSPREKKESSPGSTGDIIFTVDDGANDRSKRHDDRRDDEGLPSYEAALKLEADGYV